jgi:hypothetical protein
VPLSRNTNEFRAKKAARANGGFNFVEFSVCLAHHLSGFNENNLRIGQVSVLSRKSPVTLLMPDRR